MATMNVSLPDPMRDWVEERVSPADRDLTEIYVYSYREFGEATADAYLLGLHECFARPAEYPAMGLPPIT